MPKWHVVDKLLLAAASVNANRETVNCLVASRTWNSFSGRSHIAENTTNIKIQTEDLSVFLADRTYGRAIGTVLRPSSSSVTLCIVAKRCVLEQKLLLRAYRKSYIRNRLVPK